MTEDDRKDLADLAMRALDTINENYGEDAELVAACLTFEVRYMRGEDELYHGNYKSLARNSPHHIAGLLRETARQMTRAEDE